MRVALGKLKTVTTCNRLIRALVASCPGSNSISWTCICPEKKTNIPLDLVFFLRRGNGLTVKMEFIGMSGRTKEKTGVHEELREIRILISQFSIKMVAIYLKRKL